jgi:hypothetical protein
MANQLTDLKNILTDVISNNVSGEAMAWLNEKASSLSNPSQLYTAFAAVPRKTGRASVLIGEATAKNINGTRKNFSIDNWSVDRVARLWLLMHADHSDREKYFKVIEGLFPSAEVNELVALYSALPVLHYPEIWKRRCAEGIRNNIADVLTAIMCDNPYPSENLDEPAWNQLVLKAFFTEKPVNSIVGLDERRNAALANTLSDYAHERWAAHRPVNPQLWRCVGPFIDDQLFPDIQRLANSTDPIEREAAALACADSAFPAAKELIPVNLKKAIDNGSLSWSILAKKINDYVLQ